MARKGIQKELKDFVDERAAPNSMTIREQEDFEKDMKKYDR